MKTFPLPMPPTSRDLPTPATSAEFSKAKQDILRPNTRLSSRYSDTLRTQKILSIALFFYPLRKQRARQARL